MGRREVRERPEQESGFLFQVPAPTFQGDGDILHLGELELSLQKIF